MRIFSDISDPVVSDLLSDGKVGVIRTDTLYGLVARAMNKEAVARIYELKTRTPTKPLLLLIADSSQQLDTYDTSRFESDFWPGPHTIILPSLSAPDYLTRGTKTLAYRIPDNDALRSLLRATGPLVAPSANPEGQEPARSLEEAINYFSESVDFYVEGGTVGDIAPSKIWKLLEDGSMEQIR